MTGKPRPASQSAAPGLAARSAALRLVAAVEEEGHALDPEAPALARLAPSDRAHALRLARAALRGQGRANALLAPFLRRPPPARIAAILRLGTVEICALGTPAHAAVDLAVRLARKGRDGGGHAGLVNAVLRRVADIGPTRWPDLPPDPMPGWLREPLLAAHGAAVVTKIEAAHAAGAATDLTLRDPADAATLGPALGALNLPSGSLRLAGPARITALPGYDTGRFWVQDAAATIPGQLLAPAPGARVLDLCAAPGGKTLQLAARGAHVTALDASAPRMERLRENLARVGLAAETVVADARDWTPPERFDAILLDAPCSATGTIRRHPDLPFVRDAAALGPLIALQSALIDRALGMLRPGGCLVYCVCSLLAREGADQIAAALSRHPGLSADSIDPATFGLPPEAAAPGPGLQTRPDFWPDRGGMDGFFIARLRSGAGAALQ